MAVNDDAARIERGPAAGTLLARSNV